MVEEPTCGKGIAANAALPAKLADLMTALADTLEEHRRALNLSEPAGQAEDEAYAVLVSEHQAIAAHLASVALRMESYSSLPVASHDAEAMADPARMAPYARFVALQREIGAMLHTSAAEGEAMLEATDL